MPILKLETAIDFHNYVQRKVREGFPDYINTDEVLGGNPSRRIKAMPAIRDDLSIASQTSLMVNGHISRRLKTLIEIAIQKNIVIKIKFKGKIVNLADFDFLCELTTFASEAVRKQGSRLISKRLKDYATYGMIDDAGESSINSLKESGILANLLVYSGMHHKEGSIVFPSGKLSS